MKLIEHPIRYTFNTRVLMLKGRHKDGIDHEREVLRVSHSSDEFYRWLDELCAMSIEGERIYATASSRNLKSAIYLLKLRQLENDLHPDPEAFYKKLNARWCSCLMKPNCQEEKHWLFDCDTSQDFEQVMEELGQHYDRPLEPYVYDSKSGKHVMVQPFNKTKMSDHCQSLIHVNATMLWGY
jgi:hypothetical protein